MMTPKIVQSSTPAGLHILYDNAAMIGWQQGSAATSEALLADLPLAQGQVVEIGCGAGHFLQRLGVTHPHLHCYGVDLQAAALAQARQHGGSYLRLAQADLQHLPFATASLDLVIALDCFDQIGVDLVQGLREGERVLRDGGHLLLRVSAHPWLYGQHDQTFGTGKRYRQPEVTAAISAAGLTVERCTFANTLLALPVMFQRLLQRWNMLGVGAHSYRSPVANRLLATALRLEARWLRHYSLPIGLSLYFLAKKGMVQNVTVTGERMPI